MDPSLIAGGVDLAFNAFSASQAQSGQVAANKQQMSFNADEAKKQREFESQMMDTRYQRTRDDLVKAGYNPLMALNMSPPVPMGASASASPQSVTDTSSQIISRGVNNATTAALSSALASKARSEAKSAESDATVNSLNSNAYAQLPPWAVKLGAFLKAGSGLGGLLGGAGVGAGGVGNLLKNVAGLVNNANDANAVGVVSRSARARKP